MQIAGVRAIVTGSASGLGAATAALLAARGAQVLVADLDAVRGAAVAARQPAQLRFCRTDVTVEADVAAAVAAAAEGGALRVAVAAAGIGTPERLLGRQGVHDLARFERMLRVNLVGSFDLARRAAEVMAGNEPDAGGERGVIIFTASAAAFEGQVGQAAYAASKGGIVAMTLPLARELARVGIRVVTIAPGLFDTPLLGTLGPAEREALAAHVPFPPRLGLPDEYASLVASIVENPMLNGTTIRLDGALRMPAR